MSTKVSEGPMPWDQAITLVTREVTTHGLVRRACNHLRTNSNRQVSLEELARHVIMNKYALAHAFTKHVGIPPHEYHTCLRIQQAMELLADGVNCAAVAVMVGFSDQSHLNRQFRRLVGTTPRQYARSLAQKQ